MNMWVIITIAGGLWFLAWFLWESFGWKCTLIRLADSYIYGREQEKFSAKEAFLKTLRLRYRLKKTSELVEELENKGLSEKQIAQQTRDLIRRNLWRQNMEYRYGAILARKGLFEEATDLKMSRSLAEGSIRGGDDVESVMWQEEWWPDMTDDNNHGLLELLICGLIIEYPAVRKKTYADIAKMIKSRFRGQGYFENYLNEPRISPQDNHENNCGSEKKYSDAVLRTMYAYRNFNKDKITRKMILAHTLQAFSQKEDTTSKIWELLSKEIMNLLSYWFKKDVLSNINKEGHDAAEVNALLSFWFRGTDTEKYSEASTTKEGAQIFGKNVAQIFGHSKPLEIQDLSACCGICRGDIQRAFMLPMSKIRKGVFIDGEE